MDEAAPEGMAAEAGDANGRLAFRLVIALVQGFVLAYVFDAFTRHVPWDAQS